MNRSLPLYLGLSLLLGGCGRDFITGVVVDWQTGDAVSGAMVSVYERSTRETTTDGNGGFSLKVKEAQAVVIVSAPGYETAEVLVGGVADGGGGGLARVALIPRNGAVSGVVRIGSDPVEAAQTSIFCGSRLLEVGTTDETGAYAFDGLSLCLDGDIQLPYTLTVEADLDGDGVTDISTTRAVSPLDGASDSVDFALTTGGEGGSPIPPTGQMQGHVFVDAWTPAEGATVFLREATGSYVSTTTDPDGAFTFDYAIAPGSSWTLLVLPYDVDGDGWNDTGTATTTVDWIGAADNILLQLPANAHDRPVSNICNTTLTERTIAVGEGLYFLWDASVDPVHLRYTLLDPEGQVMPDPAASWVGSYLLELTPTPDLQATSDPDDVYTFRLEGLVFADGAIGVDPTDPSDVTECTFRVGTPPEPLPSPDLSLWRDGADVVRSNADELEYVDSAGRVVRTQSLSAVPIVFDRVATAARYQVYGRQTNGDAGTSNTPSWTLLATVEGAGTGTSQLATIDLSGFDGGLGAPLGLGNTVSLVIKPVDIDGHHGLPDGLEPTLSLQDTVQPHLSFGGTVNLEADPSTGGLRTEEFVFGFNENMDVSTPITGTDLSPRGGRLAGVEVLGATYWTSSSPVTVSDEAHFEDVGFILNHGTAIELAAGNGDGLLTGAEVGSWSQHAIGNRVGFVDVSASTVQYGTLTGLNSDNGAMLVTGVTGEEAGDRLFDPCAVATTLATTTPADAATLDVVDASGFHVGQSVRIGVETNPAFATVTAIANGVLTVSPAPNTTQEVGSVVDDSQCAGSPNNALRPANRVLTSSSDTLLTTLLEAGGSDLEFRSFVDLSGVVAGDLVRIETTDDEVFGEVQLVRTLSEQATPLLSNGLPVVSLRLGNLQAANGTTLPLTIDPSETTVTVLGDALVFTSASVADTSGNAGVDTGRFGMLVLDGNGQGALRLPVY